MLTWTSFPNSRKMNLLEAFPKLIFKKTVCETCQVGKQIKNSLKNKNFISTSRPLELLHMDLFGPSRTPSLGGKSYAFVPIPQNQSVIGTRWVFRNKMDENGIIIRNKARLVA